MLNVLTAFGSQDIQDSLRAELAGSGVNFTQQDYGWQGEIITAAYSGPAADVIMCYTGINGSMSPETFIRSLVSNTTGEILLIDDDPSAELREFCGQFGISRVFANGKVTISALAAELRKISQSGNYTADDMPRQMLRVAEAGFDENQTVTVGVMGVRAGSGATSMARDVVCALSEMGCDSVAAVSADRSGDLSAADLPKKTALVDYGDLMSAISSRDYRCVVTDYGAYAEFRRGVPGRDPGNESRERLSEFLRSDISILVSGGEPWEIENLRTMLRMDAVADTLKNARVFIRPCGSTAARSIRGIGTRTPAVIYTADALNAMLKERFGG